MINWIAVEDRLPERGDSTPSKLVWSVWGGLGWTRIASYCGDIVGWMDDDHGLKGVTHWAELSDINPPEAK